MSALHEGNYWGVIFFVFVTVEIIISIRLSGWALSVCYSFCNYINALRSNWADPWRWMRRNAFRRLNFAGREPIKQRQILWLNLFILEASHTGIYRFTDLSHCHRAYQFLPCDFSAYDWSLTMCVIDWFHKSFLFFLFPQITQ